MAHRTVPVPSATPPATPTATPPATPVPGPCPYLDTALVADTVGQHIQSTTTTTGEPLPGCSFLRSDGALAVDISVFDAGDPTAARFAVDEVISEGALPVVSAAKGGVGDGGVVLVDPTRTTLTISAGSVVVLVELNQPSSLEAVTLARELVAALPA